VHEAGVAAISFHPRSAQVHHKGSPDYDLARELVRTLDAPVILSGGMNDADGIRAAFAHTGCAAVMLARGALGDPWLFARLLGRGDAEPTEREIIDELEWIMLRAVEHLGAVRAGRYLRKFYPWYVARLGASKQLQAALQATASTDAARAVLAASDPLPVAA